MNACNGLKRYYRGKLKKEIRTMEYCLDQHLLKAELYFSLKAEIPAWGVFKANLEYVGKPQNTATPLSLLLDEAACYLKWKNYYYSLTEPVEYIQVALMYIESMNNLIRYIKSLDCYRFFSSMEDLFPGWESMMKSYREAILELFKRGDDRLVVAWMSGCETVTQLQEIANSMDMIH